MIKVVTHSSCESEYVGLSESSNEAVYLQQLQEELGIGKPSVLLLGDNESSMKLAENPVFSQNTFSSSTTLLGKGYRREGSSCARLTRV